MEQPTPKLLLATGNPGKARELAELLRGVPFEMVSLRDLNLPTEIDEPADTFEGNAIIKAESYARMSGLLTLADDSGLEIDALNGQPGVHSKRFAGEDATDEGRVQIVLQRLEDVPREQRTARYRCVLAIARPDGDTVTCEGICSGIIGHEVRGSGGFGYDPVFYLPEFDKTVAELSLEEKNQISHRARAAKQAVELLKGLTNS
ncbi:MAG: XTP/dITP diphosphatase [SAR202 cluster bacterium]|nr:XTP/dITP diphosphatase [SAR202 cluster bacterium]